MKRKFMSVLMAFVMMLVSIPFTVSMTAFADDDYPAKYKNAAKSSMLDEWKYYNRNCTSFVAWRLNSRNGVAFHNWYGGVNFGNANTWGTAAKSIGITVDMNPAVGSVFWSNSGTYGHVAWVEAVSGNNVTIEEYNVNGDGAYHRETIPKTKATGYIHIKDISVPIPPNNLPEPVAITAQTYTITNVGTGLVMNYGWGSSDKAIFCSPSDGSAEQKFKAVSVGGNAYRLEIQHSDGGVVNFGVNSGESVGAGVNITRWSSYTNNSTQHFYFRKVGSNQYVLTSTNGSGVIVCPDTSRCRLTTANYNDSDKKQIWTLSPNPEPSVTTAKPVTTTTTTRPTTTTTTTTTTTAKPITTTTTTAAPALSIDVSEVNLREGEQFTIKANQSGLTYKSNNTDVAIVSKNGVITAMSSGTAIITIINSDNDAVTLRVYVSDILEGDANKDGKVTVADLVMLEKWLLGSNNELTGWKNVDLCEDGVIDVFDMVMLRKLLTSNK